jgi:NAD(P)-dependent dehydrogenase (short-subunit alcohol dehydrogenase family)
MAAYNVSKHGVVALSETLHQDLALLNATVKVSVLCPSFTNTRILDSARNRPAALADTGQPEQNATRQLGRQLLAAGQSPDEVVDAVIDAIRSERFYVFPYPRWRDRVRTRFEDMLGERGPSPVRVEDFLR